MGFLRFVAKVVSHPVVARVIVPAVSRALERIFDRAGKKLQTKTAVKAAKAAKTIQEFDDAARKLADAAARK